QEGERCGRCDNCAGPRFDAAVDPAAAAATRERLMRPGVEITPRRQWPSGLARPGVELSGRITDGPQPGRVTRRLTDLGWGAGPRFDAAVDPAAAAATRERLMRPGVEITPRRQWPSGLARLGVELSGRITDGPEPGRVIGRLTDLGWGARLRRLLDEPDQPVP